MLDVTMLRKNLPEVVARLKTRNFDFPVEAFTELEDRRKNVQQKTEELQALRNALSKDIGMKKKAGEDATELLAKAAAIPAELAELQSELDETLEKLHDLLPLAHDADRQGRNRERRGSPLGYPAHL